MLRFPFPLLKKSFSTFIKEQESNVLLNFRKKLSALEYISSSMRVDPAKTRQLSAEELQNNRIVKAFFGGPNEVAIYEHVNKCNVDDKEINYPRNAWSQVILPLSTNLELRHKFVRFYSNRVRIGRMLEVLDYVATHASYVFCHSEPFSRTATNVTLGMDNMHFFKPIYADRDLTICAYPSYNGNSTIEIRVDLYQNDEENMEELVASTHFIMASRDISTHKAKKVPVMKFDGEDDVLKCKIRQELGKNTQERRKFNSGISLFRSPPSAEESNELHKIFIKNCINNLTHLPLSKTIMSKNMLIHLQDRNLHGKAFGGMLMREAFEIGWLAAYVFCQLTPGTIENSSLESKTIYPEIHHIDDILFITPVDIGSIIKFEAKVTFAQGNIIHVVVDLLKNNLKGEYIKASELHITFLCGREVRTIYPERYEDGMLFLEAKRRLRGLLESVGI